MKTYTRDFADEEPTVRILYETAREISERHATGDRRDSIPSARDTQQIAIPRVQTQRMGSRGGEVRVVVR